jgi:5-carboxymethyl-2-hydroxymuconic-semialdehyde dehydrogenase
VSSYSDTARADGERVGDKGWFVRPTLFTGAGNDMQIAQEEIFGQVLTSIRFSTRPRRWPLPMTRPTV